MPLFINETNINLALQALRKDPKLSPYRASEICKVSYCTLRRRHNGISSRCNTIHNSRRLSHLEEQVIVQLILNLDLREHPARLRGVEEIASLLPTDCDALLVGKRRAFNFVKRQPDLEMRFNRGYDYKRAKCEDTAIIRGWFTLVENTIAKYGISLADIYNYDETGLMMYVISSEIVVTGGEAWKGKIGATTDSNTGYGGVRPPRPLGLKDPKDSAASQLTI